MPRDLRLPTLDLVESFAPCGYRKLIIRMFFRALLDSVGRAGVTKAISREAKVWLLRPKELKYSAAWWAELADMQYVLEVCRKVVRKEITVPTHFNIAMNKECR